MMTITYDDLLACRLANRKIAYLEESIARKRSRQERITGNISGMPHGGMLGDIMADALAEIEEDVRELLAEMRTLRELTRKVEDWLVSLPEQQHKVVWLRYIAGLSWREVARRAHYSEKHCIKIDQSVRRRLDTQ